VPRKLKPVSHEDRMSVVDHLDELRSRILVSLFAFLAALALCFWQNHFILEIVNDPLDSARSIDKPVTLGVTEQFTTTLTVSAYAAILLSMPVILYQLYAFVLPAFSPTERKVALPLLLMVPFLFIGGVVFGYYVVLPNAIKFLLNFNDDEFTTLIRAREYYSFVGITLLFLGLLFQIPVAILALVRLGITSPQKLRRNRRYAILVCAIIAMLLPGTDPVTMLLSMAPLVVLFELGILLAAFFGRSRPADASDQLASAEGS
jgi:sec-independent protein translocase protein TatC